MPKPLQTTQTVSSRPAGSLSLKRPKPFHAIPASIAVALMVLAGSPAHATPQAAFVLTIQQVGSNVVATGSGAFNTTGLTNSAVGGPPSGGITPVSGISFAGAGTSSEWDGSYSGPTNFGSGTYTASSSDSGSIAGYAGNSNDYIFLPVGYTSGTVLTDTSTWSTATLTSLGITSGTYTWTWGSASTAGSYTVNVVSSVPEPSTWAMMAAGVASLFVFKRRRS